MSGTAAVTESVPSLVSHHQKTKSGVIRHVQNASYKLWLFPSITVSWSSVDKITMTRPNLNRDCYDNIVTGVGSLFVLTAWFPSSPLPPHCLTATGPLVHLPGPCWMEPRSHRSASGLELPLPPGTLLW